MGGKDVQVHAGKSGKYIPNMFLKRQEYLVRYLLFYNKIRSRGYRTPYVTGQTTGTLTLSN